MLNNKMNRKLNLSITPPIFCFPSHTCSCRPQAAFIVGLQCTCDILDAKDKEHCTTCSLFSPSGLGWNVVSKATTCTCWAG